MRPPEYRIVRSCALTQHAVVLLSEPKIDLNGYRPRSSLSNNCIVTIIKTTSHPAPTLAKGCVTTKARCKATGYMCMIYCTYGEAKTTLQITSNVTSLTNAEAAPEKSGLVMLPICISS